MQNSGTKKESVTRSMVFPNRAGFSIWMFVAAIAFLALQAIVAVASAHETGSPHHPLPSPWPYHVLLVTTGIVVMSGGMLTARYMKEKGWWLKAHKSLAISGALLTISGFIVAAYMVSTYMGTYLVMEPHAYLGITALALVVFAPIMGFMQFRKKDKRIHIIHRWSGRLAIIMVLSNIAAGWMMIRAM
jgi:heme/copper-type cytochrome/quinol oxidase subunit 3